MPTTPDYTPSQKQLAYLKDLGYVGLPPNTIGEASDLISSMKNGLTSELAEKAMLYERAPPLEKARLYLAEAEQRKRDGSQIAGWRLKVKRGAETSKNSIYNGAFLPFEVGRQFPELLAISGLDFDTELQRRPAKGPIITAPNQVSEITPSSKPKATQYSGPTETSVKQGGCFGMALIFIAGLITLTLAVSTNV